MRLLSNPEVHELLRERILEVLEEGPSYSGDLAETVTTEVISLLAEMLDETDPLGQEEEN